MSFRSLKGCLSVFERPRCQSCWSWKYGRNYEKKGPRCRSCWSWKYGRNYEKKGHAVSPVDRGNMEEIMRKEGTQGRGVSKIKRSWFSTVRLGIFHKQESKISLSKSNESMIKHRDENTNESKEETLGETRGQVKIKMNGNSTDC